MAEIVERHLAGLAAEALETFPAVVIQGARQVGKSTLAGLLAESRPHVSFSLDDREVRDAARDDPRAIADAMPDGTVVIDEIQRDLDLILAVKSAIDADRRPGRFILTGSSDLMRLTRNPDSLAGRAVSINLGGLSQGELHGVWDDFAAWFRADPGFAAVESDWDKERYIHAMEIGSFPEVRLLSPRMRNLWLDSYLDRVLTRNLGDVSRGLSADRLRSVAKLVAAGQGGELVQSRIASDLGMPKSSIAAYLSALQTMYLTTSLPAWEANLTTREVSRSKISISDSALAMRLDKLGVKQLTGTAGMKNSVILGGLLEAFVVSELEKQRGWSEQEYELYHFRQSGGQEVDIVMEYSDGAVLLIEVKASGTFGGKQTSGIRALRERLGDRFIGGVVLGTATRSFPLGDNIWGLPISTLWQHG